MRRYVLGLFCGVIIAASSIARANEMDATALFAYGTELLEKADQLRDDGRRPEALVTYKAALNALATLAKTFPRWQPRMVVFRMEYCDSQIAALLKPIATRIEPAATNTPVPIQPSWHPVGYVPPPAEPEPTAPAPTDPALTARLNQALKDLHAGKPDAALKRLVKGFETTPNDRNLRLLAAVAQCEARRFNDALYLLRELVAEDPDDVPVRIALAAAYFGLGRATSALAELELAVEMDPASQEAHYNAAQVCLVLPAPDPGRANAFYQQALKLGAPRDPRLEAAITAPQSEDAQP